MRSILQHERNMTEQRDGREMTAIKTATVTFRIQPEIKAALRQMADDEQRSLANMLEVMIRDYRRRHPAGRTQEPENLGRGTDRF